MTRTMNHVACNHYDLVNFFQNFEFGISNIEAVVEFWIGLCHSEGIVSMSKLALAGSFREGFGDGLIRRESEAELLVTASNDEPWAIALVSSFSNTENLIGSDFGGYHDMRVSFTVLPLTWFSVSP